MGSCNLLGSTSPFNNEYKIYYTYFNSSCLLFITQHHTTVANLYEPQTNIIPSSLCHLGKYQ